MPTGRSIQRTSETDATLANLFCIVILVLTAINYMLEMAIRTAAGSCIQAVGPDVYLWFFWGLIRVAQETAPWSIPVTACFGLIMIAYDFFAEKHRLRNEHIALVKNGRCLRSAAIDHSLAMTKNTAEHLLWASSVVPIATLLNAFVLLPVADLRCRLVL